MSREQLREQIRQLTGFYRLDLGDTILHENGDNREKIIQEFLRHIDVKGKSVFEIGCSFGHFHRQLADAGVSRLCGVDLFPQEIEVCRMVDAYLGVSDRFTTHQYDIERGVIKEGIRKLFGIDRFDIVLCSGVLYHLLGPLRVMLQLPSLLEVGGYLAIETAVGPNPGNEFAEVLTYLKDGSLPLQCVYVGTPEHMVKLIRSMGFGGIVAKGYAYGTYEEKGFDEATRLLVVAQKIQPTIHGFVSDEDGWIRPAFPGRDAS